MKEKSLPVVSIVVLLLMFFTVGRAQKPQVNGWATSRVTEILDRGLVALPKSDGSIYVSWRLKREDPRNIRFDVVRKAGDGPEVILDSVFETTDYVDHNPPQGIDLRYRITARVEGITPVNSDFVVVEDGQSPQPYISIRLPEGVTEFMQPTFADLNADGRLDYIIKNPDSYLMSDGLWHVDTRSYKLYALEHDGTLLWVADLTRALEVGPWYAPHIVYDFDGDGKAEVALKSGPVINAPSYMPEMDGDGRVLDDNEYLSILSGETGEIVAQTAWHTREGYEGYNLVSRNLMGLAYLDGKTPAIITCRGTYGRVKMAAYHYHNAELKLLWSWESTEETADGYHGNGTRSGPGSHFMHAADVDNDGRDEVIYGSFVIDDNGEGLWALDRTDLGRVSPGGHADGHYVGNINPDHDGLEIYYQFEKWQEENGACLVDAATGELIWGLNAKTGHFHKAGLCSDISAAHPGMEAYSYDWELSTDSDVHAWLFAADGSVLKAGGQLDWDLQPWAAYWDADVEREVIYDNDILNYPELNSILTMQDCRRTIMVADILGDWREEIIRSTSTNEMRIYMSTMPAEDRRPHLMQDPIYRIDVANNAMGYGQVPMVTDALVEDSHQYSKVENRQANSKLD